MNPFKHIKKLTAIAVSAVVFVSVPGVFAAEASFFSTDIPYEIEATVDEFVTTDGYMAGSFTVAPSVQRESSPFTLYASELPSKYDMRDYGYVTSVKSQKSLGVCWTFSGLSNMESYILRHIDANANPDFSENHMRFSTSRYASDGNWLWGNDRYPDQGGNFLLTTSYLTRGGGPIEDSTDPYQNDSSLRRTVEQLTSENGIKENVPIDIGDGNLLSGSNGLYTLTDTTQMAMTSDRESNIESIKRVIYETNAVDIGIYWNTSYYVNGAAVYCDVPILSSNHEVNIVGWDDNYSKSNFKQTAKRTFTVTDSSGTSSQVTYGGTTPEGDGAFLVKNSWGTGSGENGYYWMSYYDMIFSRSDTEAWYVSGVSTKKYDNIYQYDPLIKNAYITPNSRTCRFAARFPAKYGETVSGAGFYTLNENCNYKIRIMTTEADVSAAPVVATGYLPSAGYHMIEFDDFYIKNTEFAVVVEITSLDRGVYPSIALEAPGSGINTNAAANMYETYVSLDSRLTLYNTTTVITDGDDISVCLKAFTNDPKPDIGLSGYANCTRSENSAVAVFNLANNTGETQNAMCVTAVYKDGRLENAFCGNAENIGTDATVSVPYSVSSSDCTVKSMIFYKNSIRPVMPETSLFSGEYTPSSPAFAKEMIFINPGDKKCINIIDGIGDVTSYYTVTSSDTDVVSVNGGTLTAGSAPGHTTITASYLNKTVTADVYVLY